MSSGSAQPGQLRDSSPLQDPMAPSQQRTRLAAVSLRLMKDHKVIILAVAEKRREGQGRAEWTHRRTQPHSVTGQKATGFWP